VKVVHVDNVNQALKVAVAIMRDRTGWISENPRGMETMEWHCPVTTVYTRPWKRVLFSGTRDANPFFHLMESLWMLAGRRDAAFLDQFTTNFSRYAEEDGNLHGAYGHRWTGHFYRLHDDPPAGAAPGEPVDQLTEIIAMFLKDPNTRRAVLCMWDPVADLGADKKDIPCNTQVYFKARNGELNMTVTCRSNDIILGCYGANAVHFSVLHEYMATCLGIKQGTYTHISDSWHYYPSNSFAKLVMDGCHVHHYDYYQTGGASHQVRTLALINGTMTQWAEDLKLFMSDEWGDHPGSYGDTFFRHVAVPMRMAHQLYKEKKLDDAIAVAGTLASTDWRIACVEWLERRNERPAARPPDFNNSGGEWNE
jgi:hypothetical protein